MVTIRGSLAKRNAGGPQFRFIPQRIAVEVDAENRISNIAESTDSQAGHLLDTRSVGGTVISDVEAELQRLSFNTKRLQNTGVIVAEADKLTDVVDSIQQQSDRFSDGVSNKISKLERKAQKGSSVSIIDAFRPGLFNFGDPEVEELEANLRNELLDGIKNPITSAIEEISGVASADVSYSVNTPGPRNLGVDPLDSEYDVLDSSKPDVGDAVEKIGGKSAWEIDTGENAVVAVFDTSFSRQFLDSDRVIDTFSGQDVDSAFSAPEEGHGTMTAYSAAGNAEETHAPDGSQKVDYSGVAKDADLLLARLSDSNGAMVYIEEAWDWLASWVKSLDRPVISNHSYGIPLCSARGQGLCSNITSNMSVAMSKRDDHQAFYAAGNEAQYCGHRLSGVTNAISGANSRQPNMAVAAFRFDLKGPQVYSSHGFGTCGSRRENPKPDVGCLLPSIVPYGNEEKDMSSGSGGSNAGTSEASPITAGSAALVASVVGNAKREVIEGVLEGTATLPVMSQVNVALGYDARYGQGQINVSEAVKQAKAFDAEEAPNAVFTYQPTTPTVGQEVTFDATASTDPDRDIESYEWSFGDGAEAAGQTVTHAYEEFGTQSVVLTVTDSFGNQSTFSSEIRVSGEPEGSFVVEPENPVVSESVTFNASQTVDPDGDVESYMWDFGDGNTGTGEVTEHQYESQGEYTVTLQVTDSVGNVDQVQGTLAVRDAPSVGFTFTPESPIQGQQVAFEATGGLESYQWDLGDGTETTGRSVNHSYDNFGRFDVTVTATDGAGNQVTHTETVNVTAKPTAQFTMNPVNPTVGDTVTLDASSSTDPDSNIVSYTWDFGNGETGQGVVVQTEYDDPQTSEITLTVEDDAGNTDSITKDVSVASTRSPSADFITNPSTPDPGQVVTFDASPSVPGDAALNSFNWSLDNGSTARGESVTTSYSNSGSYNVTLEVEDALGNRDTVTKTVEVQEISDRTPTADFTISPSDPTVSQSVNLDASASSDPDNDIQRYIWDLGNGSSATGEVTTAQYDDTGQYQILLTVEDATGNTDTTMRDVQIVNQDNSDTS